MKKLLTTLSALMLTGASGLTVVSCSGSNNKVILQLEGTDDSKSPAKAWLAAVEDYNEAHPDNKYEVEVAFKTAGDANLLIESGNYKRLPNLYVSYSDDVTKYDYNTNNLVVDMSDVINFDETYLTSAFLNDLNKEDNLTALESYALKPTTGNASLFGTNENGNALSLRDVLNELNDDNYDEEGFRAFKNSFYEEGMAKDKNGNTKLYTAPSTKSVNNGIVNVTLFAELYYLFTGNIAPFNNNYINGGSGGEKFFFTNESSKITDFQSTIASQTINSLPIAASLPTNNNIDTSQIFEDFFNTTVVGTNLSSTQIAEILENLSNLEIILIAYYQAVNYFFDNMQDAYLAGAFSMGIDDIAGFAYGMQASYDTENSFYDVNLTSSSQELVLNKSLTAGGEGVNDFLEFMQFANLLAPSVSTANGSNHVAGVWTTFGTDRYSSTQWQKGGMLISYGSTAGAWNWTSQGSNTMVEESDMISTSGTPSYTQNRTSGGSVYAVQQGPGVGMFRNSDVEKNKIAADFLNYYLQGTNSAKQALTSAGYMPSSYAAYYGSNDSQQYNGLFMQALTTEQDEYDLPVKRMQTDMVNRISNKDINLWSQTPSPFGNVIRTNFFTNYVSSHYQGNSINISPDSFWAYINQIGTSSVTTIFPRAKLTINE